MRENNTTVLAYSCVPPIILNTKKYEDRTSTVSKLPVKNSRMKNFLLSISELFLGGSIIESFEEGFNPKVIAGKLSVTRFIKRICKASKIGICHPKKGDNRTPINKTDSSAKLQESWYVENFRIFLKIVLPSLIADTIVLKLSSFNVKSATERDTSVPFFPIAIPICASFKAGASLTPSPVIATISPLAFSALTILSLCSGVTLAKTVVLLTIEHNSVLSILSSSSPIIIVVPNPTCFAIAYAVSLLSPVIF